MYVGQKIPKNVDGSYDIDLYVAVADWCNETHEATIMDMGEYYECVAVPVPTLDMLKEHKRVVLESEFDMRTQGSITTSQGYVMQFDTSDSLKMQGAITLMEAVGSTVGYITQANDETVYNVPLATMKQVLVEMLNAYAQCHARKQELRALINNAKTKEELDEIVISWPV